MALTERRDEKEERRKTSPHQVTSMRLVRICRSLLLLSLESMGTASDLSAFSHLDFVKENNLEPGWGWMSEPMLSLLSASEHVLYGL